MFQPASKPPFLICFSSPAEQEHNRLPRADLYCLQYDQETPPESKKALLPFIEDTVCPPENQYTLLSKGRSEIAASKQVDRRCGNCFPLGFSNTSYAVRVHCVQYQKWISLASLPLQARDSVQLIQNEISWIEKLCLSSKNNFTDLVVIALKIDAGLETSPLWDQLAEKNFHLYRKEGSSCAFITKEKTTSLWHRLFKKIQSIFMETGSYQIRLATVDTPGSDSLLLEVKWVSQKAKIVALVSRLWPKRSRFQNAAQRALAHHRQ